MKVCPVCKSRCFDDMDICYGCLHDFSKDQPIIRDSGKTQKIKLNYEDNVFADKTEADIFIPEYFELDTFPYIEDDELQRKHGAHEKLNHKRNNDNFVLTIELPKSVLEKYIVN